MPLSSGTYLNAFPIELADPQEVTRIDLPAGERSRRRDLEGELRVRLYVGDDAAWTARRVDGHERVALAVADEPEVHLFNLREALRARAVAQGWEFWIRFGEMSAIEPGADQPVDVFVTQTVLKTRAVWEGFPSRQLLLVASSSVRWLVDLPLMDSDVQAVAVGERVVRRREAHGRIHGRVEGFRGTDLLLANREGEDPTPVPAEAYRLVARPALVYRLLERRSTRANAAEAYAQLLIASRSLLPNRRPNPYAAKERFNDTERLLNAFGREIELANGETARIAASAKELYVLGSQASEPWSAAIMKEPTLRFDAAIPSRSASHAYKGLRSYGAYSLEELRSAPQLLFVYPSEEHAEAERFGDKLLGGSGTYPGFAKLFGLPEDRAPSVERLRLPAGDDPRSVSRLKAALEEWGARGRPSGPDLAIVVVPRTDRWQVDTPYYAAKEFFGRRNIPSQMVTLDLLHDTGRLGWSLANIALASFAKLGGVPWVVDAREHGADFVVGVGRSDILAPGGDRRQVFGYAVAVVANGAYLSTHSFSPAASDDEYEQRLRRAIVSALQEGRESDHDAERVIIHLAKRTGWRELRAAQDALSETGLDKLPYALLRIDDSSLFEFLDGSQATYAPSKGLTLRLTDRRALVQVEGPTTLGPARRPLLVELDERSTVPPEELGSLVLQVFRLGHANWRGFNARSKPVTLYYGERLAELVGYLAQHGWDPSSMPIEMQNRPWFL